jgi:flagellar biosynthesis regulator FlbT
MKLLSEMSMLLTKMAVQCADFCPYSPSTLVISSFYSATAFLKHSQQYASEDTDRFCQEVRRIIFCLTEDEKLEHLKFIEKHAHSLSIIQIQKYQNQYQ